MPRARSLAKLALIASASVALAGCGATGQQNGQRTPIGADEQESVGSAAPRAAAEDYLSAVRSGDGARACDRFTRALRAGIERLQRSSCDRAVGDEARRQPAALAGYRVTRVRVHEKDASATLDGGGFKDRLTLERVAGRWLISDAPGLGR